MDPDVTDDLSVMLSLLRMQRTIKDWHNRAKVPLSYSLPLRLVCGLNGEVLQEYYSSILMASNAVDKSDVYSFLADIMDVLHLRNPRALFVVNSARVKKKKKINLRGEGGRCL